MSDFFCDNLWVFRGCVRGCAEMIQNMSKKKNPQYQWYQGFRSISIVAYIVRVPKGELVYGIELS
jgi:hypothetical protein